MQEQNPPMRPYLTVYFLGLAFVLGFGLLMDHFGATGRSIHLVLTLALLATPLIIGLIAANSEIPPFFTDRTGNGEPSSLPLATALFGIVLPVLMTLEGEVDALIIGIGCALAVAVLVFLVWPEVQRSGAFSIRQWLEGRFRNRLVRLIVGVALVVTGFLLCLAGTEVAAQLLISSFGLTRAFALGVAVTLAALPVVLGGAAATLQVLSLAGTIAAVAIFLPLIFQGYALPKLPEFDGLWLGMMQESLVMALGLIATPIVLLPALTLTTPDMLHQLRRKLLSWLVAAIIVALLVLRVLYATTDSDGELFGGTFGPIKLTQASLESLMAAATILLAMSLGMASLQTLAANITEGTPRRHADFAPLRSTRVARNRVVLITLAALVWAVLNWRGVDAGLLVQIVLAISALGLAPPVLIALCPQPRPASVVLAYMIGFGTLCGVVFRDEFAPSRTHLVGAVLYGCIVGIAAGLFVSLTGKRAKRGKETRLPATDAP